MLRGTDEMIKERVGKLSNDELKKTHWKPDDLERRLNEYNENNSLDNF